MKNIIIGIALLILCGCSSKTPTTAPPPPAILPVMTVISGIDTTYQDYPASVEGSIDVEIRPQVSGTLDKVYVDEGSFVNAGTSIYKINDQPYRAAFDNANAGYHAAEAAMANARLEIDKLTPLVENKVVSDFQLKSAKSAFMVSKANVEQAKSSVTTASINLSYTTIKAPVSGFVGRLIKKRGSLVSPTDAGPLTTLSDVRNVHVYFSLGEKDFVAFNAQYPGQTLKEKLSAMPAAELILSDNTVYPNKGKVDMVDGQFDKTTGAITLRANFENGRGLLRSGNTGKIRLSLKHDNSLIIPQSATIEVQDKVFVFAVADSNKVKKHAIKITGKSGNNYLVKDGIKAGDKIVISGIDHLQEGDVIQPQNVAAGSTQN